MPLVLISSERFAEHQTPPGHPESPERARVLDAVAGEWRRQRGEVVAPRMATEEQLARVHDEEYLRKLAALAGRAVALDPDTYTSPETYEIAHLAGGAAIDAAEHALGGRDQRALALLRPPGHHAEAGRAMGFCFYNNVAVAAAHARVNGARRIAIVDYDVHHGNGTQRIFESDPAVLYISTHQYPYYPGTGAAEEIGRGPGAGFTVNLPIEAGAVDEDYRYVFANVVLPVLRQFKPDLLLISAGFDAHERDPLGGMRLSTDAFAAMTMDLRSVAEECCEGRIAAVTEGGYDLHALTDSLNAIVGVLSATRIGPSPWSAADAFPPSRGRAAAAAAKTALAGYWKL